MVYFVVGSKSEMKIDAARRVVKQFAKNSNVRFDSHNSKSLMSDTPWDKETKLGAKNRALHAKREMRNADYYIGLESGLIKRYGEIYEEAWCCIIDRQNKKFYGYSSGLRVPDFILKKMKDLNEPHYSVMAIIEKSYKIKRGDTWGTYSSFVISRKVSLEEALRNVLIQIFVTDKSFYKSRD